LKGQINGLLDGLIGSLVRLRLVVNPKIQNKQKLKPQSLTVIRRYKWPIPNQTLLDALAGNVFSKGLEVGF
jgi:hypothetical protein